MECGALQRQGNAGGQQGQLQVQSQPQQQDEGHGQQYDGDGGFDLYWARLESYLRQRGCWNVVVRIEGPDMQNAAQQQIYEERNLFARDAFVTGLHAPVATSHL
ncbi:hypothetical protein ON010_g3810 [Phytophthora cinnamomi]|nr:hypothetical protein ON010_g3810 [Phytophthora cinnamomi]